MDEKLRRKGLFVIIVVFIIAILSSGESKAVLQANGNEGATYNVTNWMINIRKMEELGGAMGLTESINEDLTTNGESNNIDVHMQKNTEYGALAILSASSYGNPNKIEDGDTTTGNATGVVMKLNSEWVAGGTIKNAPNYANAKLRYKNIQEQNYIQQKGDAVQETKGWHGAIYSWGIRDLNVRYENDTGIVRSSEKSIFSVYSLADYRGGSWGSITLTGISYWPTEHYSRAVIVSGEGV